MNVLEIALDYIGRGWNPVPVKYKTKQPIGAGWQTRVIDAASAPEHFNGAQLNVGVILGPASQGLTDVDLDCAEAITIAPYVLPATKAMFGRPSKRCSHRLYYTDLAVTIHNAAIAYDDPTAKKQQRKARLVELRIGGGDLGAQTVFPGSIHEEGEPVTWEESGEPASADGEDLRQCVATVAAASLLARYWPGDGARHDCARCVGGFLSRAGKTRDQVKIIAEAIARAAGDPEWRDRRKAAEDAAIAHREGKKAFGLPRMREIFGKEIVDKVADWIGYRESEERPDPPKEAPPLPPARPYEYRDPASIPRREFLYGKHYIRKHVSATVAPGAIGKSSLDLTELMAMVLGMGVVGETAPETKVKAWYINGEEDQDEIDRRIAAFCQHYDADGERLTWRLLVNSMRVSFAYVDKGAVVLNATALAWLEDQIKANSIDVTVIDPWVCFQSIPEKDNISIDALVRRLKDIAERTNSAIEIVHHTRKLAPGQDELTTEDSRGGSSLMYAVRSGRVLNRMTTKIAAELGIDDVQRRLTFRIDNGKQNLSPPERAKWARLISTQIANGDNVQAVAEWRYPDAFEGVTTAMMHDVRHRVTKNPYRADPQAKTEPWVGTLLAELLNLDLSQEPVRAKVKGILKRWFASGVLDKEQRTEPGTRHKRTYIIPGNWSEEPEEEPE